MAAPPLRANELVRFERTFNLARLGGSLITEAFFPNTAASTFKLIVDTTDPFNALPGDIDHEFVDADGSVHPLVGTSNAPNNVSTRVSPGRQRGR